MIEIEEALVNAFFVREKRERFVSGLRGKRRRKFTDDFCHFNGLDPRYKIPILPKHHNPTAILHLLKEYGASDDCYVLSDERKIDAQRMPLTEALSEIVGRTFGTFLSYVPGKLAYFENENGRCILRRSA